MNKKYLLSSVMAGFALLYANQGMALDCVQSQDCAALGYTESSCSGENGGVKCPFGNKWACYAEPDNSVSCEVGTLYYSDGKCYDTKINGKTLLGVVIYSNGASGGGWIMTVKPIQTDITWATKYENIPGLTDITSTSNLNDIQESCTNTDVITAYGSSSSYPAAWAAKNYSPTGTPSGKSWCLPSGGLLNNINNSVNFTKVNAGITIAGGIILGNVANGYERVWSSSELNVYSAWFLSVNTNGSFNMSHDSKDGDYVNESVRPVLAF